MRIYNIYSLISIAALAALITSCGGQPSSQVWETIMSPTESTEGWTRKINPKTIKTDGQLLSFKMKSMLGKEEYTQNVELRCDIRGFALEVNVDNQGFSVIPEASDIETIGLKLCNL